MKLAKGGPLQIYAALDRKSLLMTKCNRAQYYRMIPDLSTKAKLGPLMKSL